MLLHVCVPFVGCRHSAMIDITWPPLRWCTTHDYNHSRLVYIICTAFIQFTFWTASNSQTYSHVCKFVIQLREHETSAANTSFEIALFQSDDHESLAATRNSRHRYDAKWCASTGVWAFKRARGRSFGGRRRLSATNKNDNTSATCLGRIFRPPTRHKLRQPTSTSPFKYFQAC